MSVIRPTQGMNRVVDPKENGSCVRGFFAGAKNPRTEIYLKAEFDSAIQVDDIKYRAAALAAAEWRVLWL